MELLLIRHAQSLNNHLTGDPEYAARRQADPPLTELGRQQALRLASWAADDPFCQRITHLHTSLTTRAVQTAAPLARALGLSVHGLTEAYECGGLNSGPDGGFAPVMGRDHVSLQIDCPDLLWPDEIRGQAWEGGGEPWDPTGFAGRAANVSRHLRRVADEADVVALITHHDFAQYLIAELLGLPALHGEGLTFRLNNTATAHIELIPDPSGSDRRVLHWVNRTAHLTPDLLTL
ncbi:histidine phosphatase family protein [Deinococcus budaensis]|uniref:2,3-bisphosphoglycerate-dependent phosphoglycerate mutase n=1 Tax=Deinococcus budaensis TaxID=1665626 RepID=A0A7W8GD99_9DEIO|nr:histidine phosphatase family protein [Deinococcus budaensis]MBB5233462.1 2,3-bisphosphoglycerate-dependent phosphoglycerate mutase [Deinococcus budaensis]